MPPQSAQPATGIHTVATLLTGAARAWLSRCEQAHIVVAMRTVVIGGTGHIGTYLVPCLVRSGHQVAVISRGTRVAYRDDPVWGDVQMVPCDRQVAEADGSFGALVAGLRPEAVVDLMCFAPAQIRQLVEALDGQHVVQAGSVWSYGPSTLVPPPRTRQSIRTASTASTSWPSSNT